MEKKSVVFTIITIFVAIITIATVLVFPDGVATANSAQRYFYGVNSTGAYVDMENCPIVVDKEDLDFYVYYDGETRGVGDGFITQFGFVTAKYTFRNPSENTVNIDVVFPYGYAPESESKKSDCKVSVDGENIDYVTRYTNKDYYDDFDVEKDVKNIKDDFEQDEYFSTDKIVYKYVYSIAQNVNGRKLEFNFALPEDCKIVCDYYSFNKGSQNRMLVSTADKDELVFYIVGADFDVSATEVTVIDGQQGGHLALKSRTEQTFGDELAYACRPEDSTVSDVDWYNALADNLYYLRESVVLRFDALRPDFYSLLRWCQYKLTFAPGQTIVNEVTVPMFPSVNTAYSSAIFDFCYYVSPASTWADFHDLTINVHTDGYMLGYESIGFEKTDGKYTCHFDELPTSELTFRLSAEENPTYKRTSSGLLGAAIVLRSILIISVILLIAGAIAGIIVAIVCVVKKKKKATSAKKCDGAQNAEYVPFADDCGRERSVDDNDDIEPEKNDAPKENTDTQSETDDTQTEQSEKQIAPGERSDVQASKDNGNDSAELYFFEPDEQSKETRDENGDTLSIW